MTEAEKLAARMKVFSALGLDPVTGMCPTTVFPTLRNIQANNDAAAGEFLTEHELEICSQNEIAPSTFLAAKPVKPQPEVFSAADTGDNDIEMCMENLSRAQAGVGDKRVNLIAAACAAERALKKARR